MLCCGIFTLIGTSAAWSQTTYNWTGSTGINWFTSTNWSPNGQPTSADVVNIDLSLGPTISTAGAAALRINVGNTANATLVVYGGGTLATPNLWIANSAGVTGTVLITGPGSSAGSTATSSYIIVGDFGTGTLTISDGGVVNTGQLWVSNYGGSTGTVTITGAGSNFIGSSEMFVGSAGTATLSISNGGKASNTIGYIGEFGSVGTASVTGAGSTWNNSGDLYIGDTSSNNIALWNAPLDSGSGTLTISNGGTVTTGSGVAYIDEGPLLNANISNSYISSSTVFIAPVAGSSGTLNIGAPAGSAPMAPGTLVANKISFGAGTGTLVFNHTSSDYVFTPAISGNGTIDVLAGTTVLTGDGSSFSGTTSVAGGTLEVDSNLAGSLSLAAGSQLQGTGAIGALTVPSGATISPGLSQSGSTGVLNVAGTYAQSAGATMVIALSPSAAGKLAVSGIATLAGSLELAPAMGTYIRGRSYDILTAGSVTGSFTTVTNMSPSTVLLGITYGGNEVIATTENGSSNFLSAASTADQKTLAAALDRVSPNIMSGNFNTTLNTLVALGNAGQQQAFNQLSGYTATSIQAGAQGNMHAIFGSISSHLTNGAGGSTITLSGDFGPNGETQVADASGLYWEPAPELLSNVSVWMEGLGSTSNIGSTNVGPGQSTNLGGVTLGIEAQPDHETRVGVAFGAVDSVTAVSDNSQSSVQSTYALALYGSQELEQFILDGSVLAGYNDATSKRNISFLDEQAIGKTSGYGLGLDTGIGYRLPLDTTDTTLTPRIGITYSYNHENGFTETGASSANLAVASQAQQLIQSSVSATLATKYDIANDDGGFDTIQPQFSLGWDHDMLNPSTSVNESFAGIASSSFTTTSANPGRDAATVGIGVNYTPEDLKTLTIYTRYNGSFSANESDNAIIAGAKYSW